MSQFVVRGKPNEAQLYLDRIMDEVLVKKGLKPGVSQREQITLQEILFHCLRKHPDDKYMINGTTGEVFTNAQLLKLAVPLTRALTARGATGTQALMVTRNHQRTTATYFAVLFAGLKPFLMDPNYTMHELSHFLKLIEPRTIFCDREFYADMQEIYKDSNGMTPTIVVVDDEGALEQFSQGYSDDLDTLKFPPSHPEDTVMYLPTSGSSGLPKAAQMTQRGLIAQLPSCWSYFSKFPTPTDLAMILTTIQWMTFTMLIQACPIYRITLLLSPKKSTVEHVTEMLETYKPTWTFLGPAFASSLVVSVNPEQLKSLETLILLGAPATPELMTALKNKLPKHTHLCNGYGTTEAQGFIAIPDYDAPFNSNGWVYNFIHYKIVDDDGKDLGLNQTGELYIKGPSMTTGYYKNEETTKESFTEDGWYKTGDAFHVDENERISFVIRKKFSFKYQGCHVAPEEVERVIESVAGVSESFVCGTDNGPTAAVVLRKGSAVSREDIKQAVNATLSAHKRLHGGVVFVESLPHTHSGKLKRVDCTKLVSELASSGLCL